MRVPFRISDQAESVASLRTPLRAEIPEEDTWDLRPLFADESAWDEALEAVRKDYPDIEAFRGKVGESARSLRDTLEFEKQLGMRIERLGQYAGLRVAEDGSNAASLAREAKLQGLLTRIGEACAFVLPEIQAISDEDFALWLQSPELEEWKVPLEKIRRQKPHTLSFPEERLLALGASAIAGHQDTFSQLTNVDMRFGTVRNDEGRQVELTQGSFSSLLEQRKPEVRREAFHAFYKEFQEHQFSLAASLAGSVRGDVFHARARNHGSAIEAALFQDDVPVTVYDNLITAVRANFEPLHRYYQLRKSVLGLDEIHHYDTYTPLVADVKTHVEWDGAVARVLEALAPLGGEYVDTLAEGLGDGRWCDRYENKGKRSGAFSYGTYESPPYIMMNYKPDVFSHVFTLAHEAGHSMHTWYARGAQSYQNYHYPIFLAEVASTFNEMLLTDHLLKQAEDDRMRAYLISRQIDDIRATLYRQTMFAEFEKAIHAIEEAGEALTVEVFRKTYRALLEAYFGPGFVVDDELELECLRIPHFYSAFYVYKYATGLAAAASLSEHVLAGESTDRYLDFLRSGGSRFPLETLRIAGVDMQSSDPVDATLKLFARRVDQLEELIAAKAKAE